jgi:hypothetical protein
MAYSDPQSVTVDGSGATSLPRTASGVNAGSFTSNDGNVQLSVSSSLGKRTRRTARINLSKIAADPLISAQNIKYSSSVYLVVDTPVTGFSVAELTTLVTGLTTWLTASTAANTVKLLGGEN